jgi:hypothetical protein
MIDPYVKADTCPGRGRRIPCNALGDPAQEPAEDECVERQHAVPVQASGHAARIEGRRLSDYRPRSIVERFDAEFETTASWQL